MRERCTGDRISLGSSTRRFFAVRLHFSLRGGQLTASQFNRVPSDGSSSKDSHYKYVEYGSKNYQGKFCCP